MTANNQGNVRSCHMQKKLPIFVLHMKMYMAHIIFCIWSLQEYFFLNRHDTIKHTGYHLIFVVTLSTPTNKTA